VGLVVAKLFRQSTLTNRLSQGITWASMAALLVAPAALSVKVVFTAITGTFPSGTPTGTSNGMGGATTTGGGNWLTFIQQNLGGQLIVAAVVLIIGAVLFGLTYLLRQKRFLSQPVLTGLLLVFLVVGSTGWWYSAAQTASAQTTTTAARTTQANFGGGNMGGDVNSELLAYLVANQNGYANIVAVSSSNSAASLYLESGKGVISLGGFSGSDNIYTSTSQVEELVSSGTVRYFLLGGQGGGQGSNSAVSSYVTSQCKLVDSSAYSSTNASTSASSTTAVTTTTGAVATGNGTSTTSTSNTSNNTSASGSDNTRSFSTGGMGNQQQQLYVCGS